VYWQDEEKPVLSSPSGGNPISGQSDSIRMHIQAYNEALNKTLDANVGKSDCVSLANGFMKEVCRGNYPNKETSHRTVNRAYTT